MCMYVQFSGQCNLGTFYFWVYILAHTIWKASISQSINGLPSDGDNKTILIDHWVPSGIGINNL